VPPPSITLLRTGRPTVSLATNISRGTDEALDQATISELYSKQISRMTRSELARVVCAGRLPASRVRLEFLDHRTLERLAHLARLCCQNREC
jgi:hypothetical protein